MPTDIVLTPEQQQAALQTLPGWEIVRPSESSGEWLRRKYVTPGWPHTMLLANALAYVAEAAWHHMDFELGYALVIVKIQTHRVRAITDSDIALARRVEEIACWKPPANSPLPGFPKNWVH